MESYRILKDTLKGKVKIDEPLYRHTTLGIGGPARIWFEPIDEEELKEILGFSRSKHLKIFVIGSGSNILVSNRGFNGVVIHLSSPYFKKVYFRKSNITAGAGILLTKLISLSCSHSLGGLEDLVGIPGTLGGALRMNAGYKRNIGDLVSRVKVMDKNGNLKILKKKDLKFGYRKSNLSRYIILEAEINLSKARKPDLFKRCEHLIRLRRVSQPWNEKSAGCVFKNPSRLDATAAALIETCGLKGKGFGGASISSKHANFIINKKSARYHDVIKLMNLINKKVKEKFGIELKSELIKV